TRWHKVAQGDTRAKARVIEGFWNCKAIPYKEPMMKGREEEDEGGGGGRTMGHLKGFGGLWRAI
ncbi:MAG: hypothetical protein II674_02405, partial [Prevotella sp.]|nr:hypothetical protein [Prevotella sp.]